MFQCKVFAALGSKELSDINNKIRIFNIDVKVALFLSFYCILFRTHYGISYNKVSRSYCSNHLIFNIYYIILTFPSIKLYFIINIINLILSNINIKIPEYK